MEFSAPDNTPITVEGFVTDPKRIGFQVLTNYENIFWRALVGSNPWSLYEVLRGYCHGDNTSCHPSIATLMAILGVKDRRSLTGYAQRKNGKKYLGWIEVLQTYELVIAEVKGEGSSLHYLFHVNLTPQLLTDKQLATLPDVLQQRHQELLEKCEHQLERLRSRRKPAKKSREASQSVSQEIKGGVGKSHAPPGIVPPSPGTIPPKQQPSNNTHKQTTTSAAVADLEKWKIPATVARQLVDEFGPQHVVDKLDYLNFKLNDQKETVKNPAGWLRTAIRQDWAAPVGYKTPQERQAKEKQATIQTKQLRQVIQNEQKKIQQKQEQHGQELHRQLDTLRQHYHTPASLKHRWQRAVSRLQKTLPSTQFGLLAKSALLKLDQQQIIIGVPNVFICQLLSKQPAVNAAILQALVPNQSDGRINITFIASDTTIANSSRSLTLPPPT